MPANEHRLQPDQHAAFLAEGRVDPFSRVPFQPGAVIVRCAGCGTPFLRESWDALGRRHCGQEGTMTRLDGPAPRPMPTAASAAAPTIAAALAAAPAPAPAAPPPEEPKGRPLWPWLVVGAVVLAGLLAVGQFLRRETPTEDVVVTDDGATTPVAAQELRVGDVDGQLEVGDDTTSAGVLVDTYVFTTRGRGPFAFAADARFEPSLEVTAPDGRVFRSAPAVDRSRAYVAVPTGRGRYTVRLAAAERGVTGAYSLSVQPQRPTVALRPGAFVSDSLGGPDAYSSEGRFETAYTLDLEAGARTVITVATSGFTPRLQVTGAGGAIRLQEGRTGDGRTYTFTPTGTGRHTIIVATSGGDEQGGFRIRADVTAAPREPEVVSLVIGEPARGTLAGGATGRFRFDGLSGQRLVLAVAAERFQPRLRLLASDGTVVATGSDALAATLRSNGVFAIELTSADSTGGPYALTARVMAPDDDEGGAIESEIRREPPGRELPTESERPVGSATYNVSGTDRRTESALLPPNPGVEATGVYRITVQPDGTVSEAEISRRSGNSVLDADALRALRRWRFESADGAAPVNATVTIRFTTR